MPIPGQTDAPAPSVPLLVSGQRLDRDEFERRYTAMPHLKRAELIEGVVSVPSPLHYSSHSQPHGHIVGWLVFYCASTPGVHMGDNATVRLNDDTEVQPDGLLRREPALGGTSYISDDDYLEGPPELMVEVAASSAHYDRYTKRWAYQRAGVQEYLLWCVYEQTVDWWVLDGTAYRSLEPDEHGILKSTVFPGLWLDVPALLANDLASLLATLQRGLANGE